jgi:hypothetical protein
MPERIVAAHEAINQRSQDFNGGPDHLEERRHIEDALRALAVLESETTRWLDSGA